MAVGPDPVLTEQGPPRAPPRKTLPRPPPPSGTKPAIKKIKPTPQTLTSTHVTHAIEMAGVTHGPPFLTTTLPTLATHSLTTGDRLFGLIQGAFFALNATYPEATRSCWLCLAAGPPYYEGTAVPGAITKTSNPHHCPWGAQSKLTLSEVSGYGLCLGTVPPSHQHLCNFTQTLNNMESNQYLLPSNNSWWACSTGLTSCISMSVFNQSKDFCIMIQLVPSIYYHPDEEIFKVFETGLTQNKREPVSLTLAVMLGLGLAAGVGTGTTSLIKGPQDLKQVLTLSKMP